MSIHGDGLATRILRTWDDAAAFDIITHSATFRTFYNIGAHQERTVLSVAQDICNVVGRNAKEAITSIVIRGFVSIRKLPSTVQNFKPWDGFRKRAGRKVLEIPYSGTASKT